MREDLKVIAGGRGSGRTTKLVEWLKGGRPLTSYPFWSRVVLTTTQRQAMWLRNDVLRRDPDLRGPFLGTSRWVFSIDEWLRVRGMSREVEVAIDNAEEILWSAIGYGNLTTVTIVASEVETL